MEQLIEITEYKIFTKTEGEGLPLLLLHSYWGDQRLFDVLTRAFSKKWKVIRIDLPGHGQSGNPPPGYTFDTFAVVLNELLMILKVQGTVSVIGHSMGGYLAMAYATKFPEKIASLILMHSPAKAADGQSIKLREREGRLLAKGKRDLLLQATIPSNFAPENSFKMQAALHLLTQTSSLVTLEGALGSIRAINLRANSLRVLQNARFPVLIIAGQHDKVYQAEDQLVEAEQIPNSQVLLLHHSGHLGFMEEEELVIEKISDFLNEKIS